MGPKTGKMSRPSVMDGVTLADHSDSAGHTIQQMDDETGFKADLKLAAAV